MLIIPLMIVSSISFSISRRYDKYLMDMYFYADNRLVFTSDKDSNLLNKIDILSSYSKDISTVNKEASCEELLQIFMNTDQCLFLF